MPANLPPQYYEAENVYRLAKTPQEKVRALEVMLAIMPKHKGTDKLRADLRRRMAKHTEETERKPLTGKRGYVYDIKKEGAGQAVVVGPPNVGKSELVATLTDALPQVADYPFTTQTPTPGMMRFENIQIQLVDTPPLAEQHTESWLQNILRSADLLLLVVDLSQDAIKQMETILAELEKLRIKPKGQEEDEELELAILKKALVIGNKSDLDSTGEEFDRLRAKYSETFRVLSISVKEGSGLEELKRVIYDSLNVIRLYTKAPGQKPDLTEPVILKKGSTVEDVAEAIHKDFRHKLKYALVWGSGKFEGQRVKREHVLADGDVIELHT
ncbi:MAG: hypothetical protein A2Y60_02495 [Chloroflexi bacterium RBG_13_54_9]|nr:MAG: hypothetical protein A2Y60_02495 [Chloroflexi bacterium RBG_13_54_9]HJX70214.1 GTPase [Dehalococcoidia bacterium]